MLLSVTFSDRIHGFQSSNHTEFKSVAVNGNRGRKAKHKVGIRGVLAGEGKVFVTIFINDVSFLTPLHIYADASYLLTPWSIPPL